MIPISALLQAVTATQARALFVQALVNLGVPANLWKQGGVASTILTVVATTYANFSSTVVAALSAGFLPTASGAWLVLLAYYVYGITAIVATSASGSLTLVNPGGGIYTFATGTAFFGNAATLAQYTNAAPFTLGAATTTATVLSIPIQCTTLGSQGNADPGDITVMLTPMGPVTCSNPSALAGQDQEPDDALRTRCTNALAARSVRGPRNAYKWAITSAVNATTGQNVNINRVSLPTPAGNGTLNVYCASPSGPPSAGDLAAAQASVEANVRPEGIVANVLACSVVPYSCALTVWVANVAGLNVAALQTAIGNALTLFFAAYPIGGLANDAGTGLFGSAVESVIGQAVAAGGTYLFDVEQTAAPGLGAPFLALAPNQVAEDEITIVVRAVGSQ